MIVDCISSVRSRLLSYRMIQGKEERKSSAMDVSVKRSSLLRFRGAATVQ